MVGLLLFLILISISNADIRISPSEGYDFGLVTIDTQRNIIFEVKNVSPYTVHICSIEISGNGFSLSSNECLGNSLNPDNVCLISAAFFPRKKEIYEGKIVIKYDDNGNNKICDEVKMHVLNLKGTGINIKVVKVYPEPLAYGFYYALGDVGYDEIKRIVFRLCNAGGSNVVLSDPGIDIKNLDSSNSFGITYNTCNNAVLVYHPNNENCQYNYCEFEVAFRPSMNARIENKHMQAYIKINDLNGGPFETPSGLKLFISGKVNIPENYLRANVGEEVAELFKIDFTCPNNGNETAGEVLEIGKPSYTVTGSYFYIDENASSCPSQCIEGQTQVCNVVVKFKPLSPGIYEGNIIISLPIRYTGIFGKEYVLKERIIGIAGDINSEYINFRPEILTFSQLNRLLADIKPVEITNSSSSSIPFDLYTLGAGFGISKVNCSCNENYYYDGSFCVRMPDKTPNSPYPYILKPGQSCNIMVYFYKPFTLSSKVYKGTLNIDTPIKMFSLKLEAYENSEETIPISISPPTISPGGNGGGCNSAGGLNILYTFMIIFLKYIILKIDILFRISKKDE